MSCQGAYLPNYVTLKEKWIMKTHSCFPFAHGKGGVGGIGDHLAVVTTSAKNEIWLGDGEYSKKWIGRGWSIPEVVVLFDGKVWSLQSLPVGFDKSKSVVVSFEKKHIRFYDFVHMQGCYYVRPKPEEMDSD
jgi:hypothetical protein